MTKLPYVVECKSTYPFFEAIAAFNCKEPAVWYALDCANTNTNYTYRVRNKASKVLIEISPTKTTVVA